MNKTKNINIRVDAKNAAEVAKLAHLNFMSTSNYLITAHKAFMSRLGFCPFCGGKKGELK
ncbi:MAG: hypothetical protein WA063_05235 [Minisyncoccia bacterium]